MMMETLSRIRRNDLTCLSYLQYSTYSSIGWRKITWRHYPTNRKTQTRKIFQHRRIHQSLFLHRTNGFGNLHPPQRSRKIPRYQYTILRIIISNKENFNNNYIKTLYTNRVFCYTTNSTYTF